MPFNPVIIFLYIDPLELKGPIHKDRQMHKGVYCSVVCTGQNLKTEQVLPTRMAKESGVWLHHEIACSHYKEGTETVFSDLEEFLCNIVE